MAKKHRPIPRPSSTSSPSPQKINNTEQDGTNVDEVQPISNHEPMSSFSNPNSKSQKRPNGNKNEPLSRKRTKNEGTNAVVVDSKPRFQRFWSFDDEIIILKGMVDFISKIGSDPFKSFNDFHSFIKKSLQVEASAIQLKEKIRKLKLKFKKKVETPSFSNPHDSELFELSKKIWGNAEGGNSNASLEKTESGENKEGENAKVVDSEKDETKEGENAKVLVSEKDETKEEENVKVVDLEKDGIKKGENVKVVDLEKDETKEGANVKVVDSEKDEEIENDDEENKTILYLMKEFQLYGLDKEFIKNGMELLGESKRMELEKAWKEVQDAEFELSVRRVELVARQARLILEAIKSSNH
ncbi:unnamed protein product [Lupinus luteus]|uniref:Glabrous enhancer-binding protein-like DBD domain-containing protein n=1 Tax=Lupinus luteus TaxID=3873 RepID=A0AAV1VZW4_LUPLU